MTDSRPTVDVHQLLVARLWIARLGENDVFGWWRTDGILGPDGAFVGPRVLPKTHATARARIAFAVARHACAERHPDPGAHSLFSLDPETEDRLDAHLVDRLADFGFWGETMSRLEKISAGADMVAVLLGAGVVIPSDVDYVSRASMGPDHRSLPLEPAAQHEETIRRLAAGFTRSSPRARSLS